VQAPPSAFIFFRTCWENTIWDDCHFGDSDAGNRFCCDSILPKIGRHHPRYVSGSRIHSHISPRGIEHNYVYDIPNVPAYFLSHLSQWFHYQGFSVPKLSQPAVSGQIRTLETQIGRDLFTRTSRGIIPTAAAHELARSSGPHIDALELLGETAQISDYEGTVHLGGPTEFLTQRVLPSLSPPIRNGLGFRVTVASPDKLIDQLSKHAIDLAVTGVKITKSGISYDLLYDEKACPSSVALLG
jgi:Bacterial regulatory helix-turn-helix protein, lysR family